MRVIDSYRFETDVNDASFVFQQANQTHLVTTGSFIQNNLTRPGRHTWSIWVKTAPVSFNKFIICDRINTSTNYYFYLTPSGTIRFQWRGAGTVEYFWTASVQDSSWHHLLLVESDSAASFVPILYVDGFLAPRTTVTAGTITSFVGLLTQIGSNIAFANNYFDGKMDQLAFWDSDQSAQVADIYNGGTPADLTALATPPDALWNFNADDDLEVAGGVVDSIAGDNLTGVNMTNALNIDTTDFP